MPNAAKSVYSRQVLGFLRRRIVFVGTLSAVVVLGGLVWRFTTAISKTENHVFPVGVAELTTTGEYLGMQVVDETRDQYLKNPWLRLAMNEGFSAATAARRSDAGSIVLRDGTHPEDGAAAVIVTLKPKPFHLPNPPFDPVAVRRGSVEPGATTGDELEEVLRMPNQGDLDRLKTVWSDGRYADAAPMFKSFRTLLIFVVVAGVLFLAAAAYRLLETLSSQ